MGHGGNVLVSMVVEVVIDGVDGMKSENYQLLEICDQLIENFNQ